MTPGTPSQMCSAAAMPTEQPHIPVLLRPLLAAVAPVRGTWLDGTFGAGGYTRALLDEGAGKVFAIDRDPLAFDLAAPWAAAYGARLVMREGVFSALDTLSGEPLDGVVLDLGVSSMQIDRPERGFSFQKDGPLDMRMSGQGPTAADLVNRIAEGDLADLIYLYGEERVSRRIAHAIVAARPVETTLQLALVVQKCLPRQKPGQSHPATRTFQALRIAVNDEYGELYKGLSAAERALKPGGLLAVVTFHSVEDRMVKRFLQLRSGGGSNTNRYAPAGQAVDAAFEIVTRKAVGPDDQELTDNPRSRSAKLRIARRTAAPAAMLEPSALGMPLFTGSWGMGDRRG
jgi:16S rRNA (cytosine1402-N4)-methyltransferase